MCIFLFFNIKNNTNYQYHYKNSLSGSSNITCTYQQILNTRFYNDNIIQELPEKETNPMVFTYTDFFNSEMEARKNNELAGLTEQQADLERIRLKYEAQLEYAKKNNLILCAPNPLPFQSF